MIDARRVGRSKSRRPALCDPRSANVSPRSDASVWVLVVGLLAGAYAWLILAIARLLRGPR